METKWEDASDSKHCARHSVSGPRTVTGPLLFLSQPVLRRRFSKDSPLALGFRNNFYLDPRRAAKAMLV